MGTETLNVAVDIIQNYLLTAVVLGCIIGFIVNAISGSKFLGCVVGILLALVVMFIPYVQGVNCEACGYPMGYGQSFCSECGHNQDPVGIDGKIECVNCHRRINLHGSYCPYCGTQVAGISETPEE